MTVRPRAVAVALVLAALSVVAACSAEPPDYQSVWSTTNPAAAAPTAPTTAQHSGVSLAEFLEQAGVDGQPVAPDKLTDLTVSMPTPAGWQPYQDANLAPGTRMIAKGDTYPTAMLMVFELDGEFDVDEALAHADVDAESSENFRRLNSSAEDFNGFPSSMIEGSYDLAGVRLHSYNRIVIPVTPEFDRYLVQFTVTTLANQAAVQAPEVEEIIRGFSVTVK